MATTIKKIPFDFEVITPMFLGGANPNRAELRPASIKGLLRYWWRALQVASNLENIQNKEAEIFGSVDKGGSFAIQMRHGVINPSKGQLPNHPVPVEGKSFPINILEYLAFGTYERRVLIREYLPPNTKFSLTLKIHKQELEKEILTTFYVFSLFSGIGSRSRNGFGSFDLVNKTKVFEAIKDSCSIDNPYSSGNLKKLISKGVPRLYSAFSEQTKVFRTKQVFGTWDRALACVGKIYRDSRLVLEGKHHFEKRQYIGSPIVEKKVTQSFLERHAKPYFMKISREQGKYVGYILYLPSRYCDGLDKDRNKEPINHSGVNKSFEKVCSEFNKSLANQMETLL